MVVITNGTNVLKVTRGAFDGIYKCQGYTEVQVADAKPASANTVHEVHEEEETAEQKMVRELEEKPLSQWSKAEVRKYAEIRGIDLTGTKNVSEAKTLIQSAMEG